MRKIKGSSNYLRNQVRKNFAKAVFSALIFAAVFVLLIFRILSTLQVDILEGVSLVFLFGPLVLSTFTFASTIFTEAAGRVKNMLPHY